MMTRLIDKTEIAKHRQISKSVKDITINQFIEDAQLLDLAPLLGERFYFDIVNNQDKYDTLLNEHTYDYDSITANSAGLKKVLSIFTYARYIFHGTHTDTPFGYVDKQTQDGTPVSRGDRKEIYTANKQTAFTYWEQVMTYLNRHPSEFPHWSCNRSRRKFKLNII